MLKLLKNTLVQFFIIGGGIFLASSFFTKNKKTETSSDFETILIDSLTIKSISKQYEEMAGQPPSSGEMNEFINNQIVEEILYREAKKAGFEQADKVKKVMAEEMKTALEAGIDVPNPTEEELKFFFEENKALFPSKNYDSEEIITFWKKRKKEKLLPEKTEALKKEYQIQIQGK